MALLATQQVSILGLAPTYTAAAGGGDTFAVNDHAFLIVKNGSGASITVTVDVPGNTKYGQAAPDVAVVVPAAGERHVGPFPADLANATDFLVHVTYSGVTSLTVAVVGH